MSALGCGGCQVWRTRGFTEYLATYTGRLRQEQDGPSVLAHVLLSMQAGFTKICATAAAAPDSKGEQCHYNADLLRKISAEFDQALLWAHLQKTTFQGSYNTVAYYYNI